MMILFYMILRNYIVPFVYLYQYDKILKPTSYIRYNEQNILLFYFVLYL